MAGHALPYVKKKLQKKQFWNNCGSPWCSDLDRFIHSK